MKKIREGYKMTEIGEIPKEWEVIKLNECGYLFGGNAFKSSNFTTEYNIDDYQVIRMGNVQLGKLDLNKNPVFLPNNLIGEKEKKYLLNESDVIISLTGTVNKTDYGNVSWVDKNNKYLLNQRVACLRNTNLLFNNRYYYYFLQSNIFRNQFFECGVGGTGNQANVSINDLSNINVLKLPIREQEKIASILSTIDEQIDNVDGLIEKNKELKKGLMQQLLTKGIGHTKFKKTEIGDIPEEWEVKKLDEIILNIKSGLSRSLKDEDIGIPCIRSNNINNYKFDKKDLKYWLLEDDKGANINDYILQDGDILINFINSLSQIGKTCLYKDIGRPVIYTTNIFRMKLDEQYMLNKYFYYISQTKRYDDEIKLITKPAVNQASFTVGDFKSIKISVPCIREQENIVLILSEVDEKIEEYENKKQKLEELKKGLMQQLLTGKVRVI